MSTNEEKLEVPVTLSEWLKSILVDPLSKKHFVQQNTQGFRTPCGFQYRYRDGVPDFRVRLASGTGEWLKGQLAFESWIDSYFDKGEADANFYKREQVQDGPVYEAFKPQGRVLDVGGQLGYIRKYLEPNQEYCSIDPFVGVHLRASKRPNLFANYPLATPINFLGGYAEFLPFQDCSFDVVNMRSCIDHFFNPEIALLEAFRVLKNDGQLIIGLTVEGRNWKSRVKEFVRPGVSVFFLRYKDHHVWRPTYEGLVKLCGFCGFDLTRELWQTADVLYASFVRRDKCLVTVD